MRLNGLVLGDRDTDNHEKKCHFPIILWAGGLITGAKRKNYQKYSFETLAGQSELY
jgi:hypothetical protein